MPFYLELTLVVIAAIVIYHLLKIPTKRLLLIANLKVICKRQGFDITVNHVFRSMFKRENVPDIIIKTHDDGYRVFILTTRFHRARYHFPGVDYFEIMGKGVLFAPIAPLAKARQLVNSDTTTTFHYEYHKRDYENFDMSDDGSGLKTVLLIHPIPLEVSVVKKSETVHMWNGDELYNGIIFYSGSGFRELLKRK